MKIGILQTGRSPEEMAAKHGDYDDLFKRLLDGRGFEFDSYKALDGELPSSVNDADGWLITGSKFGTYEGHDWIAPLEAFLREAFAAGVPIVGVCFGHQILAQALGGKVEKFSGGWAVGPTDYVGTDGREDRIMAWHQDQVTVRPQSATVIGSNEFCENAMLAYGDKALTVQPHPEFTSEFLADLVQARRDVLPAHIADLAEARLNEPLTSLGYADRFEEFFKRERPS
jgi:GMP synthase (glutamine-hydrolysing)